MNTFERLTLLYNKEPVPETRTPIHMMCPDLTPNVLATATDASVRIESAFPFLLRDPSDQGLQIMIHDLQRRVKEEADRALLNWLHCAVEQQIYIWRCPIEAPANSPIRLAKLLERALQEYAGTRVLVVAPTRCLDLYANCINKDSKTCDEMNERRLEIFNQLKTSNVIAMASETGPPSIYLLPTDRIWTARHDTFELIQANEKRGNIPYSTALVQLKVLVQVLYRPTLPICILDAVQTEEEAHCVPEFVFPSSCASSPSPSPLIVPSSHKSSKRTPLLQFN